MRKYKFLLPVFLLAISFQSYGIRLSLEQCMDLACRSNPALLASLTEVEKASALTATAFDAPNTGIELSQDATDGGGMENGLKFSQEFEFPTVYIAKRKVLKAEHRLYSAAYEIKRNEICTAIASTYYSALRYESKIGKLRSLLSEYESFVKVATSRYNAGETSRLECINAERMADKARMEISNAESELRALSLRLMELTGSDEPVTPMDAGLILLQPEDYADGFLASETLQGQLSKADLLLMQKQVEAARQAFMPGLFVAATSQLLIKSFNPYNVSRPRFDKGNFMGFQVGVTVPLFFGAKSARLSAAKREVEIARYNLEATNDRLSREFSEALNEFATAESNLRFYEERGLNQAAEMVRLSKVSYELGEIDYMEYIQNIEAAAVIEMEYIDVIDRYNQAVINIKFIKGTI